MNRKNKGPCTESIQDTETEENTRLRLKAALKPLSDISELMEKLPPKARYIGPGSWLEAIKKSYNG